MKPRNLPLALAAAALFAAPCLAQTTFAPSVLAVAQYTDNLQYAGPGSSSDTAYVLGVDLPVGRQWKTGDFNFRYNPTAYRYQDTSALDRTDHTVAASLNETLSRRSSMRLSMDFSRTQAQALFASLDDPDVILSDRTNRDRFATGVGFDQQVGQRWNWNAGLRYTSLHHSAISGFPSGSAFGFEDRTSIGISTGFGRQVSRATSVGLGLQAQKTDLDVSPDETSRSAAFTLQHQIDRRNRLGLSVGAFNAHQSMSTIADRSGAFLQVDYAHDFRTVALSLYAGHRPTSGGSIPGTSTDTTVGAALAGRDLARWSWQLSSAYSRRDPAGNLAPNVSSRGVTGSLTWSAHPKLGVRLQATRVHQTIDMAGSQATDLFGATLGLVWTPRGAKRTIG